MRFFKTKTDSLKKLKEEVSIEKEQVEMLNQNLKDVQDTMLAKELSYHEEKAKILHASRSRADPEPDRKFRDEIDGLRAASSAHQTHNSFLSEQISRLTRELEMKNESLEKTKRQLNDNDIPKLESKLRQTTDQFDLLKERYFITFARGVKMQGTMLGWYCNIDIQSLYEQAIAENRPLDDWPNWITQQMQQQKEFIHK